MTPVPPASHDPERTRAIQRMFSAIAPTYDLLNRILSFGVDMRWRRALVARLPRAGQRVLDLACGTADVALEAARARPGCHLFGADFSLPMLHGAQKKIRKHGLLNHILLQNAAVEDLPFRAGVFDAVTIAFGMRNVVRRNRALAEILRVLKPGGRVLILDFSIPANPIFRFAHGLYFERLLPFLGGLISGDFDAYRYLPQSVAGFPPRQEFRRTMQEGGYVEVDSEDFTLGVVTLYRGVRPEPSVDDGPAGP